MTKIVEQTESSFKNIHRQPAKTTPPKDQKDDKQWLIRTEDFTIWGPYSFNELLNLAKNKKLSRKDYIARSSCAFENLSQIPDLQEVVDQIPETSFDEITDKSIVNDEPTIKDSVGASYRFFRNLFNFSIIPLNTVLWILLFIIVTSYCLYYVARH